jgi:hypothetical protein
MMKNANKQVVMEKEDNKYVSTMDSKGKKIRSVTTLDSKSKKDWHGT